MRKPILFFILPLIFLPFACNPTPPEGNGKEEPEEKSSAADSVTTAPDIDCRPGGELLEGNRLLIRDRGLGAYIVADSTTYDENLGASHRLLVIMALDSCREVDRKLLPINLSPDVPYLLADVSYHRARQVIAIKGLKTIWGYDLRNRQLLGPKEPDFLNERTYADAQSGNILRLEVWEDYLLGYAADLGAFAFTLNEARQLQPYLPVAEFPLDGLAYRSVFLMPATTGRLQAIIPMMDLTAGDFRVKTLFEQPMELRERPQALAQPFVFLGKASEGEAIIVDLQKAERIELPAEMRSADLDRIERWLLQQSDSM